MDVGNLCLFVVVQEVPTLGLWVGPEGVAACSNEVGFTEANVRALCDVGQSSKINSKAAGKADEGATGEKGIGELTSSIACKNAGQGCMLEPGLFPCFRCRFQHPFLALVFACRLQVCICCV